MGEWTGEYVGRPGRIVSIGGGPYRSWYQDYASYRSWYCIRLCATLDMRIAHTRQYTQYAHTYHYTHTPLHTHTHNCLLSRTAGHGLTHTQSSWLLVGFVYAAHVSHVAFPGSAWNPIAPPDLDTPLPSHSSQEDCPVAGCTLPAIQFLHAPFTNTEISVYFPAAQAVQS